VTALERKGQANWINPECVGSCGVSPNSAGKNAGGLKGRTNKRVTLSVWLAWANLTRLIFYYVKVSVKMNSLSKQATAAKKD
jgi:hypothetical protein